MKIVIPKESLEGELRVAATPESVQKLVKLGCDVVVESGLGETINVSNDAYAEKGARLDSDFSQELQSADAVLRVASPSPSEITQLKTGAWHVSYLDPFFQEETVQALGKQGVSAVSMQMIPRTTLAQKMDALSSQANLAGYISVILASERLNKIFPMMTTAAGTISPARVLVIGVGVAGLQAIATAKRLGARVEAYDTRPVVEEQVQSLGAKFLKIDIGDTGQTAGGYANALTAEQIQQQQDAMTKFCAQADVVITTAQVFGRKPPVLLTASMVQAMQPGSVIVDMAAPTGGNVEGSIPNKEVDVNGVRVIGLDHLPGRVSSNASAMYASNLVHLITHFWDADQKTMVYNEDDDIIKGSVMTHDGQVVFKKV